jgi:hypothetical protein
VRAWCEGEGRGTGVQDAIDPAALGWLQDLDREPDGRMELRGLRGLLEVLSPAGSEGRAVCTREVS